MYPLGLMFVFLLAEIMQVFNFFFPDVVLKVYTDFVIAWFMYGTI